MGHCVLSFVSSNEILCGLVIFVCGRNRSVVDLDRLTPLCSRYPFLRWFFRCGAGWRCVVRGALCPLVRFV